MHGMYDELLSNLAILVLSGFVGFAVISKVPNTLHTPLMSGTNAIHGIVVLGVGVAGLQALATAKRLGARTTGYDVRPEVADQVRSVGAQWLDVGIEAAGEGGYARELTEPGQTVVKHDVTIASPLNLPATMPEHASELYSKNITALLDLLIKDGKLAPGFDDEVIAESCVTRGKDS